MQMYPNGCARWLLFCAFPLAFASAQVHEHGVAEVGIAVDGTTVQLEFLAPGSAIVGFEHEARSAVDRQGMEAGFQKFRQRVPRMFLFDESLGCRLRVLKIALGDLASHSHDGSATHSHQPGAPGSGLDHAHDHLDVRALVDVSCRKPVKGAELRFAIKSEFPAIDTLRVQVVGDDFQTGAELRGKRDTVRLGR